jgi:hypothetical protein
MAVNKNGGIPIGTNVPIATLTTIVDGKAQATEIFEVTTTRKWLDSAATKTAGTFAIVTSTGTASIYVYDGSGELTQQFNVNTTSSNNVISSTWTRLEAVGSTTLDLSITRISAKKTGSGGTMSLDFITGTGNYGPGSGTAAGGTSGYVAGQLAHVVVIAGGGGAGGRGVTGNGSPGGTGGAGGYGGVAFTNTAFTLTGTYPLTVGTGGAGGNDNNNTQPQGGNTGGVGNASTGFSLSTTGGSGGQGGSGNSPGASQSAATNGGPAVFPQNTDIHRPSTYTLATGGAGGFQPDGNPSARLGQNGRILVLRWTP